MLCLVVCSWAKKEVLGGTYCQKKELNRIYLEVFITSVLGVLGNGFLLCMRCFSCLVVCFTVSSGMLRVFLSRPLGVLTALTGVYYVNWRY